MNWWYSLAFLVVGAAVGYAVTWLHLVKPARARAAHNPPVIDSLMGIFDSRFLQRRLAEEVSRSARYGLELSVMVLDVDEFARVNVDHGLRTGDQVLTWLGRLLEDGLRSEDVAGRSGGDEMVVITPSTGVVGATQLAHRLRRTIETFEFLSAGQTSNRQPLRCTVSVGVACMQHGETTAAQMLDEARAAAAEARAAGGNRVVVRVGDHGDATSSP